MRMSRTYASTMIPTEVLAILAAIMVTAGCGTPGHQVRQNPTGEHTTPSSALPKDRAALAAEIRDHARYLEDRAARQDRHADDVANKVGPADEGILYQTRSLADELRRQADEARRMADRIDGSAEAAPNHYVAAGQLYQQEAQRLQAEADAYERQAASIRPLEDPKGFRRNELIMAAQRNRQEADKMFTRYFAYAGRGTHQ
ncbi:MAG: hypothetical protein M3Z35_03475 [Nitrospirota bacterium]|nr:hypothetical protein [Nitrospirota bacterium]